MVLGFRFRDVCWIRKGRSLLSEVNISCGKSTIEWRVWCWVSDFVMYVG